MLYENYTPKKFTDSKINLDIIKKLKNLNKENFMNMIIYGSDGTGKYILSLMLLTNIFDDSIYKTKQYNNNIDIVYSIHHYEIILNKNKKFSEIIEFIKTISENINISSDYKNVILIKNAQYLDYQSYMVIKTLIESRNSIYFILICNNISKIPSSLNNLFLKIRVPKIKYEEIESFIEDLIFYENINIQNDIIEDIIINNKNNLTKILFDFYKYSNTEDFIEHKDTILNSLCYLILKNDLNNLVKIREMLYEINIKNISKKYIIKFFFNKVVKMIKTTEKKIEFSLFTSHIDKQISKSYKSLIHIEYYVMSINKFIE